MPDEQDEPSCALNIRDFPREVIDACKKQAIDDGDRTLRKFVIRVLKKASEGQRRTKTSGKSKRD